MNKKMTNKYLQIKPNKLYITTTNIHHLHSLTYRISHCHKSLIIVVNALMKCSDENWNEYVTYLISSELQNAVITLTGILDSMIIYDKTILNICEMDNIRNINFCNTSFTNDIMNIIRNAIRELRSFNNENQTYEIDLWTMSNFWKHYVQNYSMKPTNFSKTNIRDFVISFGDGTTSGPILHDIIIPAYNLTCQMMSMYDKDIKVEKIMMLT